ncbi:MAG TPA: glycosyltransferase family 4 protein [Solirubrobacteraceae bacterium]|nr:glycosyltransferase family 4 protein [Solirubrobacteraceae bacterium]
MPEADSEQPAGDARAPIGAPPPDRAPQRLAFLVWDGLIGGAELFTVALAAELRSRGVESTVIFVGHADQLEDRLRRDGTPFRSLGLRPGSRVLTHPRRLAAAVAETGATAAILDSVGYLGPALRLAGFRGHIVGVEHGALIPANQQSLRRRAPRLPGRILGLPAYDAEVAVSAYMERLARDRPHHRRLVRLPHGVRLPAGVEPPRPHPGPLRLGFVGRLVPGKGVDVLLRALARLGAGYPGLAPVLAIAGDGPARPALERLARRLGLDDEHVAFLGWTSDITRFWATRDLAVAANDDVVESFCLAVAEALAAARPAIVSDRGALPELVVDEVTGVTVCPGDVDGLARALERYRDAPDRLTAHGAAARRFAEENLGLGRCADRYLDLLAALPPRPPRSRLR